jgi:hypothetical protein
MGPAVKAEGIDIEDAAYAPERKALPVASTVAVFAVMSDRTAFSGYGGSVRRAEGGIGYNGRHTFTCAALREWLPSPVTG